MKLRTLAAIAAMTAAAGLAGCDRNDPDRTSSAPAGATPPRTAPSTPGPAAGTTPPATADRSAGEVLDDAGVTAKVKAALLAEKGVDGMKINVDTREGNVTLTGTVPDPGQIERAVQVARGVEGVKAVDSKLTAGAS